jgi:hypothetical protein
MQASQQSELIDQRRNNSLPINFETSPVSSQPGADPALPVEGVNESPEAQTEVTEEVNIQ